MFQRVTDSLAAEAAAARSTGGGPQPRSEAAAGAVLPDDTAFERLCALSGVPGTEHLSNWVSCGNTQECFAALFVNPEAAAGRWRIHSLLHGSDAWQLASNPNVVLYTWRVHVATKLRAWLGYAPFSSADRVGFSRYAQSVGRRSSERFHTKLARSLLSADEPQHLPRVFFCSLTWLTPGFEETLAELDLDDEDDDEAERAYRLRATQHILATQSRLILGLIVVRRWCLDAGIGAIQTRRSWRRWTATASLGCSPGCCWTTASRSSSTQTTTSSSSRGIWRTRRMTAALLTHIGSAMRPGLLPTARSAPTLAAGSARLVSRLARAPAASG